MRSLICPSAALHERRSASRGVTHPCVPRHLIRIVSPPRVFFSYMPLQKKLSPLRISPASYKIATVNILKTDPGSYAVIAGLSIVSSTVAFPYSFRLTDGRLIYDRISPVFASAATSIMLSACVFFIAFKAICSSLYCRFASIVRYTFLPGSICAESPLTEGASVDCIEYSVPESPFPSSPI